MMDDYGFTTRAVLGAKSSEPVTQRPLAPPLYQAATFAFDDMDEFAEVGRTKTSGGFLYSRWANPTVDTLARTIASLEGAEATACFSSGMGAIYTALTAHLEHGDHVVSSARLYGGTHSLFAKVLPRAGITTTLVDVGDLAAVEAAFTDRTRVLYAETIANPMMSVADLDALASIAQAHGALFVVDATFTPPPILQPIAHGVDLSVHSATKYFGGHSDVTAGVVSGSAEAIERIRRLNIDVGAIMAPFDAWLILRGIQTLALRVDRIASNALALARALEKHPRVERVLYPGLESHADHALADRLFDGRFGGMLSFEAAGGFEAGRRVMERVRIASPAASLGGTSTLIVHPPSITHTQLTAEQRTAVGITEGMLRMSVGIEDVDDIVADLDQALS